MNRDMVPVFLVLALLWAVGVVVKGLRCLSAGTPYVFSMWDGGLLRRGKRLDATRTKIKIAVVGAIGVIAALWLSGLRLPAESMYVMAALALVSIISDLGASDQSSDEPT